MKQKALLSFKQGLVTALGYGLRAEDLLQLGFEPNKADAKEVEVKFVFKCPPETWAKKIFGEGVLFDSCWFCIVVPFCLMFFVTWTSDLGRLRDLNKSVFGASLKV